MGKKGVLWEGILHCWGPLLGRKRRTETLGMQVKEFTSRVSGYDLPIFNASPFLPDFPTS